MGSISGETIRRAASGDHGAFNDIYKSYQGGLRTYINTHINDKSQTEDVLQNTFVAVFKNIGNLKNPDGLKTWLYKIAYNECMNVNGVTKRETERYASLSSYADEDGNEREFEDDSIELPEDFATNAELQKLLTKTLNSLKKDQRDCLVLYYYQQKPIAEIAKILGVSENAVRLRKKSALERLKRKLEKYRDSYNFAVAPMGLFVGKLVGTGKVKSAYIGMAVVKSASAGVIAAAMIGAAGLAGIGYLSYMGDKKPDQNYLPDQSIVIEDKSDSEEDILKEYEMPEQLKNLDWTEIELSGYDDCTPYLVNNIAAAVPLPEDGIPDYRVLRLSGFRRSGNIVQYIYDPYYSSPEDYTMITPVIHFEGATGGFSALRNTLNKEKLDNKEMSDGKVYTEGDKVIFSFEHLFEDIPELKDCTFSGYSRNEGEEPSFINISLPDGTQVAEYINAKPGSFPGIPAAPVPEDYSDYSKYYEDKKSYLSEYGLEPYEMIFYTSGGPRPVVTKYGLYNFNYNIEMCGFNTFEAVYFLKDDGSITIYDNIPKLYLGKYDRNGNLLNDPYNQSPYDKIRKINIDPNWQELFEINDDILYSNYREVHETVNGEDDRNGKELLWIPPDTHYDTLQLPDGLAEYYSDEALQRLNADHIYLGADSEGFVEQLVNSTDPKAKAILAQIRADNYI